MSAKRFNQKFVYTELAKPSLGHTEPYNLFAVIIDATQPYMKQKAPNQIKQPMSMCNIKMIDPSLNIRAAQILKDFETKKNTKFTANATTQANLTFFGYDQKQLPKVLRVGDIIRIQNVNCTEYKGMR